MTPDEAKKIIVDAFLEDELGFMRIVYIEDHPTNIRAEGKILEAVTIFIEKNPEHANEESLTDFVQTDYDSKMDKYSSLEGFIELDNAINDFWDEYITTDNQDD